MMPIYNFVSDANLVLDLARRNLDIQISGAQTLESKAATFFAASSALVGLFAAVLALQDRALETSEFVLLLINLAIYSVSVVAIFVALWPRSFDVGPDYQWAWNESQKMPADEFIATLISSYEQNRKDNVGKKRLKEYAVWATGLSTIGQIVCLLILLAITTL